MTALGVFAVYVAIDFVWALYTKHIMAKDSTAAGLSSAAIIFLNGLGTIGFTSNHWLLIPAGLGAFAGTWLAINLAECRLVQSLRRRSSRRGNASGA